MGDRATEEQRAKDREYQRLYRLRHPEKISAYRTLWNKRKRAADPHFYTKNNARHIKKNPERAEARRKVTNAILRGDLIRPARCETCGRLCHAHAHHADYTKPLEVKWVCRPCHLAEHGKTPQIRVKGDPK